MAKDLRVICHMISSVDGRLLPGRWSSPLNEINMGQVYENVVARFHDDGWMVGRVTMAECGNGIREEAPASLRAADAEAPTPFVGQRDGRRLAVVFDSRGVLRYSQPTLSTGEHLVAVLSERVSDEYLQSLQAVGVSYVFEGRQQANRLSVALSTLAALFNVKALRLEGGGQLNGSFLSAGLIDELSVMIYPGLDGLAAAPSIFEAAGDLTELPTRGMSLELLSTATLTSGMVHLHYRLVPQKSTPNA